MLLSAEIIHQKAERLVKRCGTRDTVKIAEETGVYVHFCNDFETLLGMYTYMQKERHILLNANMDTPILQMVCGHELGHDVLHRRLAKTMGLLPETMLSSPVIKCKKPPRKKCSFVAEEAKKR